VHVTPVVLSLFMQAGRTKPIIAEAGPFDAAPGPQALLLAAAAAAGATSAAAAAAAVAGTRLLSDVPETLSIDVGKPARVVDAALKKELMQVRFRFCYVFKVASTS
jgi:hypothetical protein